MINTNPTTTSNFNGPKILKYQSLIDQTKTPFIVEKSTYPVRRLWLLLVTRKSLYEVFIRNILLKSKSHQQQQLALVQQQLGINSGGGGGLGTAAASGVNDINGGLATKKSQTDSTNNGANAQSYLTSAYKIVHKDQEAIYSFCLNEKDKNVLAFCTSKEIIEIDMKNLLIKSAGGGETDECDIEFSMHGYK